MTKKIIALSMLVMLMVVGMFSSVYAVSLPGTFKDVSGNENNATTDDSGSWASGQYGRGVKFISSNSYITVPTNRKKDDLFQEALDLSGEQTIMFWFTPSTSKVSSEKNVYTIQEYGFNKYNSYVYGAAPYATGNNNSEYDPTKVLTLSTYTKEGDIKEIFIEKDWQKGKWYHFTGIIDPDEGVMKIYINGKLETQQDVGSFKLNKTKNDFTIGGAKGFYDYTRSKMDEVRIYNRVLTDDEIQKVFESNVPLYNGLLLRLSFELRDA